MLDNVFIAAIVTGLVSLALGILLPLIEFSASRLPPPVLRFLERVGAIEIRKDYQTRVRSSLAALSSASKQLDDVLADISRITHERETTVADLEHKLSLLGQREGELKSRIDALERVPIEAVHYFEKVLRKGERRSAMRDYMLFGFGVVVTTAITILLRILGY
jgi:hypothetical protein